MTDYNYKAHRDSWNLLQARHQNKTSDEYFAELKVFTDALKKDYCECMGREWMFLFQGENYKKMNDAQISLFFYRCEKIACASSR